MYWSARSPIFAFLNAIGMRLTRISMRVRRPWAWRLYCARSFRARSVTDDALMSTCPLLGVLPWATTYSRAGGCQQEPSSGPKLCLSSASCAGLPGTRRDCLPWSPSYVLSCSRSRLGRPPTGSHLTFASCLEGAPSYGQVEGPEVIELYMCKWVYYAAERS